MYNYGSRVNKSEPNFKIWTFSDRLEQGLLFGIKNINQVQELGNKNIISNKEP